MCGWVGADEEWTQIKYWKYLKHHFPREWLRGKLLRNWFRECRVMIFRRAVMIFAQLGAVYFGNYFHSLWSIEIVESKEEEEEEEEFSIGLVFSKVEVPGGDVSRSDMSIESNKMYVLESSGELFFLYFWGATLLFKVYRLNLDTMDWERIKYLEDRAFFIGKNYCLSCPVSVSGSGRIYFTTKTKDGNLYSFHLKDESVSVSPLSCTPWLSPPIWIMSRVLLRPEDNDHNNINKQRRSSTTTTSILELDENRDEHTQLCNLPLDVLEQLASNYLIPKDYLNFRATSRTCRSVTPLANWRSALSGSSESANYVFPCPLLMFADKDESVYKFVDPSINNNNNNYYLMKIPNPLLDHKIIRYSSHGWLLLSESIFGILLYNPFTREIMSYNHMIPSIVEECLFFIPKPSGIGIDDTHSFCSVISVSFFDENQIIASTIDDPWAEEWTHYVFQNDQNFKVVTQISPILFKEAFYYLDQEGNLGKLQIDFETGDMSWEVLDKSQKPTFNNCIDFNFHHHFLVECGGELISVFLGSLGKWIAIYKLNDDRVWQTVTNLGSYDLYLSITTSLSVLSNLGGNRIYFPSLRGSEIVYGHGQMDFSGSQDSAADICGTRWLVNSCWIKPTW